MVSFIEDVGMYSSHPITGVRYAKRRRLSKVLCENCGNIFFINTFRFNNNCPATCGCQRHSLKYTDNELLSIAVKYTILSQFITEERNVYELLGQRGLREEACSHMEGRKALFKDATKCKGIYFLYNGPEVVYIGKSSYSIGERLVSHYTGKDGPPKDFDKVVIYEIENLADMHVAEIYLINQHCPVYNKGDISKSGLTLCISNLDSIIDNIITIIVP